MTVISNTKVNVIKIKIHQYLNKMKPYLKDNVIDLQKYDTWKI